MMERVCFTLYVKLDRIDEYVEDHERVGVDVLEALTRSGWHNYSLFLNRKDGCLITYCEVEDFQKALDAIASEEVSLRWQAKMADYFVPVPGKKPAEAFERFVEVFHLQ
jgi:L-rhamnose mutarotase